MNVAAQVLDGSTASTSARRGRDAFRLQPIRALKAVRRLIADKEDTVQVFEIMRALAGKAIPKGYRRLLSTPEGGRIAYERDEFAARLSDPVWLASFGPGTVGAAYRDFIAPRGLSAEGLAEESRKIVESDVDAPHPLAWYGRRLRDVHDVWHVLTGYNTDALGEVCVVAFSYAQTRSLGFAAIALAGTREFARLKDGNPYGAAVREAWSNGRSAAWLPAVDYPALFAMPLTEARERLSIKPNTLYRSIPAERRDKTPSVNLA
ncbi:MAG: ubiquinone biosynthesis protein [Alphaproteobacteria bacterium]|nr:ubiquinone biosynthesis protein [Alphaproteobacteria bacterium]